MTDSAEAVIKFELKFRLTVEGPGNAERLRVQDELRNEIKKQISKRSGKDQFEYRKFVTNYYKCQQDFLQQHSLVSRSPYNTGKASDLQLEDLRTWTAMFREYLLLHTTLLQCLNSLDTFLKSHDFSPITQRGLLQELRSEEAKNQRTTATRNILEMELKRRERWNQFDKKPYDAKGRTEMLRKAYMLDSTDLDSSQGQWQWKKTLGHNMGDTTLWVQLNEQNIVIDKLVRKDQIMNEQHFTGGRDWYGDAMKFDDRVSMEYYLQKKCADARPKSFPTVRKWAQIMEHLMVRIYMQYCPHADLQSVINSYHSPKRRATLDEQQPIPEPALWMIFDRMVDACLIMRQGDLETTDPKWLQIVHRDIKANNVFLDTADPNSFPNYPVPKLGDFGLAFETSANDPFNPRLYNSGGGTKPYRAPEQSSYTNAHGMDFVHAWPLLDYTNVFAVGRMMWHLASGIERPTANYEPDFLDGKDYNSRNQFMVKYYSETLLQLIEGCTKFVPHDRLTLEELKKRLKDDVGKLQPKLRQFIQMARIGRNVEGSETYTLEYLEDEYKMGMCMDPSWTSGDDGAASQLNAELQGGPAGAAVSGRAIAAMVNDAQMADAEMADARLEPTQVPS
ncbi:hypothetical protein TI39_contig4100g00019 [Zymoseptoria brevis]|uniref:Protein kinase domain-containing protein n=1 Tax=Zymoseptoria brevis TaxID=1047168 RepID=A0A0F4GF70_9PEZI|nr:hypothetical protein TI39_contig4100g00019 [Zymoseptoria brevis]